MSAYFTGVTVEELDSTERWSPDRGKVIIRHWKGAPALIEIYKTQARQLSYSYQTHYDGPYLVLSVDFVEDSEGDTTTPLSDEWEADRNYFQKDIWTLPVVQAELAKIGPANNPTPRGFFRRDLEALANGNPTSLDQNGNEIMITLEVMLGSATAGQSGANPIPGIAETYGADPIVFLDLFDALTRGVTSWELTRCVLRRTIVTNKTSTIKSSRESVDKIFTSGAINALLPSDVKLEAPTTGYYLKKEPEVRRIERGRWEIVQEYWHADAYEELLYGSPVA